MITLTEAAPELGAAMATLAETALRCFLLLAVAFVLKLALRYTPSLPRRRRRMSRAEIARTWVDVPPEISREGRRSDCNHVGREDIVLPDGQKIGWMCVACREPRINQNWVEHGSI